MGENPCPKTSGRKQRANRPIYRVVLDPYNRDYLATVRPFLKETVWRTNRVPDSDRLLLVEVLYRDKFFKNKEEFQDGVDVFVRNLFIFF
jgi:hypothetical protein